MSATRRFIVCNSLCVRACRSPASVSFAGAIAKSHQLLYWGKEQGQHHTRVYAEYRCQMGVSGAVEQFEGAAKVLARSS